MHRHDVSNVSNEYATSIHGIAQDVRQNLHLLLSFQVSSMFRYDTRNGNNSVFLSIVV